MTGISLSALRPNKNSHFPANGVIDLRHYPASQIAPKVIAGLARPELFPEGRLTAGTTALSRWAGMYIWEDAPATGPGQYHFRAEVQPGTRRSWKQFMINAQQGIYLPKEGLKQQLVITYLQVVGRPAIDGYALSQLLYDPLSARCFELRRWEHPDDLQPPGPEQPAPSRSVCSYRLPSSLSEVLEMQQALLATPEDWAVSDQWAISDFPQAALLPTSAQLRAALAANK